MTIFIPKLYMAGAAVILSSLLTLGRFKSKAGLLLAGVLAVNGIGLFV